MTKHVVLQTRDVPDGTQKLVTIAGRDICVFNQDGRFYALLDRCPHEGGSLCRGLRFGLVQSAEPGQYTYSRRGEFIKCTWHAWEFDITTGQSWYDPKKTKVRSFNVVVESGETLVKGPYVAESFPVAVEDDYIVIDL